MEIVAIFVKLLSVHRKYCNHVRAYNLCSVTIITVFPEIVVTPFQDSYSILDTLQHFDT